MRAWQIENTETGVVLGTYRADDEAGALDAMACDAGYADHASAQRVAYTDPATLSVTIDPTPADNYYAESGYDAFTAAPGKGHVHGFMTEALRDLFVSRFSRAPGGCRAITHDEARDAGLRVAFTDRTDAGLSRDARRGTDAEG